MAAKLIFLMLASLLIIDYVSSASTGKPDGHKTLEKPKTDTLAGVTVHVPGDDSDGPVLNRQKRHKHKVVHHVVHHGHGHGHGHVYKHKG